MASSAYLVAILFPVAASFAPDKWKPEYELRAYTKKLADGSTLTGTPVKLAERAAGVEYRGTARRAVETTEATFVYRFTRTLDKQQESVWDVKVEIVGPGGDHPLFRVKDAEMFANKLYLLHTPADAFLRVQAFAKDRSGRWTRTLSTAIEDRRRSLHLCRLFQDSGGVGIRCSRHEAGEEDAARLKPNDWETWDIRDGDVRKRSIP